MQIVRTLCLTAAGLCLLTVCSHAQSCNPVCGPTSSTVGDVPTFSVTTGNAIQDSGQPGSTLIQGCPRVMDYPGWNVTIFDINYVMSQILTGNGTCVSFYGLSGTYYGSASPFSGVSNPSNEVEIQWPSNVQIVTSVPWVTPNLVNIAIMAVPGGSNAAPPKI
jgi:hypothetical protein